MMSKKHYIKIARVLNGLKPVKTDLESVNCYGMRLNQWDKLVERIAEIFEEDNPRFDKIKFYKACSYL